MKLTERLSNGSITQSICQCQFITYVWQIMNAVISTKPVELFKYYLMVVDKIHFYKRTVKVWWINLGQVVFE